MALLFVLDVGIKFFNINTSTYFLHILIFEKQYIGLMPVSPESQDVVPDGAQWDWKTINNIVVYKRWYIELGLCEEMRQAMQIERLLGNPLKVWKNKSKTGEHIMWMVV
jgi:hypothetical protein